MSYARHAALTRHFRSGAPRQFTLSPDGRRILFLRSSSGTDSVDSLHLLTLREGAGAIERIVVDPRELLDPTAIELDPAERARRERIRESSTGITSYDADMDMDVVCLSLGGRLITVRLNGEDVQITQLETRANAIDPRISPSGAHVAYVADRSLHLVDVDGSNARVLCESSAATKAFGLADFIAAEELSRSRGYWWAPDSSALIVEEYDESLVAQWWISDPTQPEIAPVQHRYPRAGTPNPLVRLWLVALDGQRDEIEWDHESHPYLVGVNWSHFGNPLVTVLSRDQRSQQSYSVDPQTAETMIIDSATDSDWVQTVPGLPCRGPGNLIAKLVDDPTDDTTRIVLGDTRTPSGLHIRALLDVDDAGLLISASTNATENHLYSVSWSGDITALTSGPGWHIGRRSSATMLTVSQDLESFGPRVAVTRGHETVEIASRAETPALVVNPTLVRLGARDLRTAVILPAQIAERPLPVIMWPYGGPHHQEVISVQSVYADPQWLADQGFAVVIADGRGTPGRGPSWERAISGDLASAILDDQISALQGAADHFSGQLDLTRVGITGWSFGGYLAALAVLRRPDVFHVGVAGAPVTDWRLYDTCYTERYLGHPDESPGHYEDCSLLSLAPNLTQPLMLIHGLADDNVVAAHSLRLSAELTAAGRPHTFVPLSGVTHMTPQVDVAENLMLLQLDFFRTHLHRHRD